MKTVRIYFDADETSPNPYYRDFEFIDYLPFIGIGRSPAYNGKKVVDYDRLRVDSAQANRETVRLAFFKLTLESDEDGKEPDFGYICVDADAKLRPNVVLTFYYCLAPSIKEANLLLARNLHKSNYLAEELYGIDDDQLIQEYWGISEEQFDQMIAKAVRVSVARWTRETPDGTVMIEFTDNYINFVSITPLDWNYELLTIERSDITEALREGFFPPRTMKDLNPLLFDHIVDCCEELGGDWLEYEGNPAWFDAVSYNRREVIEICDRITRVCCAPLRELLDACGMTPTEFSKRFRIGKSTVDSWLYNQKPFKTYLRLMFGEAVGLLERRKQE